MYEFDMVKLVILLLTGPFIEFDCSSERSFLLLRNIRKIDGTFESSEFEGLRFDYNIWCYRRTNKTGIIFAGIIYDVIVEPPSIGSTTDERGNSKPVSNIYLTF